MKCIAMVKFAMVNERMERRWKKWKRDIWKGW